MTSVGSYREARRTSPRMFERDWMEWFTHVHPTVPWLLVVPLMAGCAYVSSLTLPAGRIALWAVIGLGAWTLVEYLLHRFLFHYHPRTEWGKKLFFTIHGVHHDYPDDATRLVMPPALSVPLAAVTITLLWFLGGAAGLAYFIGFGAGYLAYDTIHYVVHYFPLKGRIGKALRAHHMRHHFKEPDRGYGVSNPFWDHVFRTTFRRRTKKQA